MYGERGMWKGLEGGSVLGFGRHKWGGGGWWIGGDGGGGWRGGEVPWTPREVEIENSGGFSGFVFLLESYFVFFFNF